MIKKILALVLVIAVIVLIVGCAKQVEEQPAPAEPTTESAISEVESDLGEIDTLEEDLGLSELEDLEKELEEIEW